MRTIQSDSKIFYVTCFDEGVYIAEKNIVRCYVPNASSSVVYTIVLELGGKYGNIPYDTIVKDNVAYCEIDLTDYIKQVGVGGGGEFSLRLEEDGTHTDDLGEVEFSAVGLIDCSKIPFPLHPYNTAYNCANGKYDRWLLPPTRLIEGGNLPCKFAMHNYGARVLFSISKGRTLIWSGTTWSVRFNLQIGGLRQYLPEITLLNELVYTGNNGYRLLIEQRDARKQYASVRWLFPTGYEVLHVMEIANSTLETGDSVEIETLDGQADVRKGMKQTLTLKIGNLCAYDCWYYGTICSSSVVKVGLLGVDGVEEERQVKVTTSKVETSYSDEGKQYSLDIEVTFNEFEVV